MDLKTKNWEIWKYNNNTLLMMVPNNRLANKINKALENPYDCNIKVGEEPVFSITSNNVAQICKIAGTRYINAHVISRLEDFFNSNRR